MPKPTLFRMTEVKVFLANKLVEACIVNMAPPVSTVPLPVPINPIPPESILGHPLDSNIQDILEDFDMKSVNFVGMEDENAEGPTIEAEGVKPQPQPLSLAHEVGTTSRTSTPRRPQSLIPADVDRVSRSRLLNFAEASNSKSTLVVKPSRVDWTVGGKLAKLKGDFKGNPFQVLLDLIPHEKLKMEHNIPAQGMAEQMMYFKLYVSVLTVCFPFSL